MTEKPFDIIIYGATSFVGRILCHYLNESLTDSDLHWAMAGRSKTRLNQVKVSLGKPHHSVACIVADADDEEALRRLCRKTRVVISTVGPYALYGETLVRMCAECGTDYCDLTGEPQWIRRMIDRYQTTAQRSGARIVHCCGFDSIPSDLGVYFLQQVAKKQFGDYCQQVKMRVKGLQGGASGGTVASLVNVYRETAGDRHVRDELQDLYSLCPQPDEARPIQHNVGVEYDPDFDSWVAPFVMAPINTRVVLRTNALLNPGYHRNFLYDEGVLTGDTGGKKRARRIAWGLRLLQWAMIVPPLRWLVLKFLPQPGEGPTPEQQRNGFFELRFIGHTEQGQSLQVRVSGDRDPGYGASARMLAQAGMCLAFDVSRTSLPGGFWTPATAFGKKLIRRLIEQAGLSFQLLGRKNQSAAGAESG
ncbi:MAG: saccharopine dehydrogenase NADP-binding domain-containing protein [Gammaproteobacteria bacterium]|nr:saccharopine dehydrogenase NADP-binding domain-containing protein [Pseudomonadales bacterium]MCP5348092.1 saccharopine dehydrogenase NADP-binding domain-containing protein [Pseudomonadales bacterium]